MSTGFSLADTWARPRSFFTLSIVSSSTFYNGHVLLAQKKTLTPSMKSCIFWKAISPNSTEKEHFFSGLPSAPGGFLRRRLPVDYEDHFYTVSLPEQTLNRDLRDWHGDQYGRNLLQFLGIVLLNHIRHLKSHGLSPS